MPTIEFALDPADIDALLRFAGLRANRSHPTTTVWFDTPTHDLAASGLALATSAGLWQLGPLRSSSAVVPPPILAEARRPDRLTLAPPHPDLPDLATRQPVARLDGTRQTLRWTGADHPGPVRLVLLRGRIATAGRRAARPVCRLQLEGDGAAITALAALLAAAMRLHVPRAGLADQAFAAMGLSIPAAPLALGSPRIHRHQTVSDSLALIIGHLANIIVHWSDRIVAAPLGRPATEEPVHQMRVATRRLRSALSVYKPAVPSPALADLAAPLQLCAARLGVAREWDVFLGGLGARLVEAFPDDPRCQAMMRAAARRRRAAYAGLRAYLAGPDFRTLVVALACAAALRPWQDGAPPDNAPTLSQDTAVFAAQVLARRLKRVRQAGRHLDALPIPALHELRKDCKRLRYAAEFFTPLFTPKRTARFVGKLAALQEELGLLNDSAAVAGLMAQLGRREHGFAAGLAEGFSAAGTAPARSLIEHAWKHFRAQAGFWKP